MPKPQLYNGFSKLSKNEKLTLAANLVDDPRKASDLLRSFWHRDSNTQKLFDEFSENTISNYYFPFGVAPNFMINGKMYLVPMVIEESSVVAAASNSAKFWAQNGGFHAEVVSMTKVGQVHFLWEGNYNKLHALMPELKAKLIRSVKHITANMNKRGGGIRDIELINMSDKLDNYYQLKVSFDTVDSMGANFINSCLEEMALYLKKYIYQKEGWTKKERHIEVIMSILSNYTPDCLVRVHAETDIDRFASMDDSMSAEKFAWKFQKAVEIASVDEFRATTHNKGIFNGIDAVALATGQDFRAIEAGAHTYAARNGHYSSLTDVNVANGKFRYTLEIPLAVGTVGGLTALHPLAKFSLELLDKPDSSELMKIAASVGLANNFSALKSLVTKGIQIGHMKMHLYNILNHIGVSTKEKEKAIDYFKDKIVSFSNVHQFIDGIRSVNTATN